jgi:hypothetical protein
MIANEPTTQLKAFNSHKSSNIGRELIHEESIKMHDHD